MSTLFSTNPSSPPLEDIRRKIPISSGSSILAQPRVERIVYVCAWLCVFNFSFSEALKEICLTAGFVFSLLLIGHIGWKSFIGNISRWTWPFGLFVAVSFASGAHSINAFEGLRGAWGDFESLMSLVLFSAVLSLSDRKVEVFRGLFVALMGGLLAGGIFGLWVMGYYHKENLGIMNLGDKNSSAQFLSYVTILVFFFQANRKRLSLPYLIFPFSYALIAVLLYFCHSRTFILTIPVFLLLMILVLRWWKTLVVWASVLLVLLVLSLINPFFKWEITSILRPTSDGSFESRYPTWEGAIRMWKAHPLLGVGPDNFHMPNIHKIYNLPEYASHGHNIFFNLLGEYGLLGVLTFSLWLAVWGIMTVRSVRRKELPLISLALYIGLMTDLIMSGIAHPMWGGTGSLAIMLILMTALNARTGSNDLNPSNGQNGSVLSSDMPTQETTARESR
jgi:putative inorganic carbon (HCO3(-)) transporter